MLVLFTRAEQLAERQPVVEDPTIWICSHVVWARAILLIPSVT